MNGAKVGFVFSTALVVMASTSCPLLAKPTDMLKYLNPVQKKGYLNESQDRTIKKKSFKSVALDGAEAIPNKEIGLFALLVDKDLADQGRLKELLADPRVNGLSVLLPWRDLEPEESKYQWQTIDKLLDLCRESNKSLILRVATCGTETGEINCDTPKWVFDAGAKSVAYTLDGKARLIPVYWDSTYLAKWSNFINAMGEKYDKNPAVHSIGITGGGIGGGSAIWPTLSDKAQSDQLEEKLKKEFGMNQHQLVEHWKYVADLFPRAFKGARLNFDIDPPTPNRAGESILDEISDYLVYRYGQRVYLTRQNVASAKHGFDQYRVLLKFRPDTLTGYQLAASFPQEELSKLVKNSLDDGVSFAEVPASLLTSKEATVMAALDQLRCHLGYQVVSQKVTLPSDIKSGEPLKAGFSFVNLGAATPMRPSRQFDKDVASSYKVQLELRDLTGKPVVLSLHTPHIPTNKWTAGQNITWEEELKMPKLQPGQYSVWISLIDADTKRKLQIWDAAVQEKHLPDTTVAVGKIQVLENN